MHAVVGVARGVRAAVRGRRRALFAIVAIVLVAQVLLPPVVLSLARNRWDFFTF